MIKPNFEKLKWLKGVIALSEYDRKKSMLSRYLLLQRSISGYGEELAKWASIGTKINQTYSDSIGSGGNTSKTEIGGINLAEIKKSIIRDLSTCMDEREAIKKAIETAPIKYRDVLTFRYVNGLKEREIADLMEKDERSARRIIKEATLSVKG